MRELAGASVLVTGGHAWHRAHDGKAVPRTLASSDAAFITGRTLVVDGGQTAMM